MTDILVPPLQIKHDQIDVTILEVVRKIDTTAQKHKTPYFLAGATARELILHHVFGRPPGRRTLDVDFGLAVRDWKQFQELKTALIEQAAFAPLQGRVQRLVYPSDPSVIVDLIPFGGIEGPDRTITWPPEHEITMTVAGFHEALDSAVVVRLEQDLVIKVVGLPALLILKLLAWNDRKHENRDAADIYTVLKEYGDAGNEERLYGEELAVLEVEGYDLEIAGARLIGIDAARIISQDMQRRVAVILKSDQLMQQLINQVAIYSHAEHFERCELLVMKFRDAFLSASQ